MFFIIVGCGRVGSELAYDLYKRGHQVTVVDHVGSSFQHLDPDYRGRTIEAEVLAEGVLVRAGIEQAQGLAAVTNSDSVNAVVCHVARTVFHVPHVVARNYDPRWRPVHEALGLTVVSSTAWGAQRIEELLESPAPLRAAGIRGLGGARALRPPGGHGERRGGPHPGRAGLVAGGGDPAAGGGRGPRERHPGGGEGPPGAAGAREGGREMFVLIAGGGRTGAQLAAFLVAQKHEVRLLEHRREILSHIHRELPTEIIYEGNATDPHVLERAEVGRAQVMAACMSGDAENLSICFIARERYKVPRTIATINNPRNAWLFDKNFHVDVALNQADILASLIEQEMSLGDMMTLLKLKRGRYSLVGEKLPAGARAVGLAIKDLPLPKSCVITAVLRGGDLVIPRGAVQLEAGDEVLALVDADDAEVLAVLFGRPGANPGS